MFAPVHVLHMAAALMAIGILLRVLGITTQSLWGDDGFSLHYSACDAIMACFRQITSTHSSEQFDILYFFILHLWRDIFGDSTVSLRALSTIASILTLPLIWSIAAALFGRQSATWSLALSAISGFAVFYAHEVRPYAFLILISSLQFWLLVQTRVDGAAPYWKKLFLTVSFIASWASIFSLIFTVAIGFGDLLARRQWSRTIRWWLPVAIVCIPAVAYYILRIIEFPPDTITAQKSDALYLNFLFVVYGHLVGQTYSVPLTALRGIDRWSMLAQHSVELAFFFIVCALLFWQVVSGIRQGSGSARHRYGIRLVGFSTAAFLGLCLSVAAATHQNWLPRHAFALHLLFALLLPAAACSPEATVLTRRLRLIALSALLVLNLWSLKNYYFEPVHWRDDYRGVAAYLKEQHAQGRPAVLLIGMISVLRHYGDEYTIDGTAFDRTLMPLQILAATDDAKEVLVVVNREFALESEDGHVSGWKPRGLVVSLMSAKFDLIETRSFQYFTIYRFAQK